VGESPDGHVTLDLDPAKRPRVVALIDGQQRLRWVGRLVAGPDLERGVILLEGFFDYNAHHVEPGLLTLPQLTSYLASGDLVQVFRATLAFPDRAGGLEVTADRFEVEHDAIARVTRRVDGLSMACLEHPQLAATGDDLQLFFHCRQRPRTLTLAGQVTGVDRDGAILVTAVPLRPFLYRDEFARYAKDAAVTGVERQVEIALPGGEAWSWRVDDRLIDPAGGRHDLRSHTAGSRRAGGKTSSYRTYRFAGAAVTITDPPSRPGWASDAFALVQWVDAQAVPGCRFRRDGAARRCRLRPAAPVWTRDAGAGAAR
jgi:hypothetical protein